MVDGDLRRNRWGDGRLPAPRSRLESVVSFNNAAAPFTGSPLSVDVTCQVIVEKRVCLAHQHAGLPIVHDVVVRNGSAFS
ncbi:MAG: hypothetical protein ACI9OJ_002016 [Myxococcota bacterium]|jgi:hypothetical protein